MQYVSEQMHSTVQAISGKEGDRYGPKVMKSQDGRPWVGREMTGKMVQWMYRTGGGDSHKFTHPHPLRPKYPEGSDLRYPTFDCADSLIWKGTTRYESRFSPDLAR